MEMVEVSEHHEGRRMAARQERFKGPGPAAAIVLDKTIQFMNVFSRVDTAMPSGYIRMFLLVARYPGKTISEYANDLGVYSAVGSRILLEIGPKARMGGKGLGLVDAEPSPTDMRIKHYFLTSKGRKVYQEVITLYGGEDIE